MPRISASCADERGPNRPAKALRRLATNGAAASADRPSGSRPPRRAIVGRRAVTSAIETPTPVAATRSSARLRQSARRLGDGLNDGDRNTTNLETALLACEVSCRARRGSAVASCDLPRSVGPPSSDEEVRPLPTIAAMGDLAGGSVVRGPTPSWYHAKPNRCSVLWGCVVSTGPSYRRARAEDAAQASLIRQQNEVPGNRQSTLALAA